MFEHKTSVLAGIALVMPFSVFAASLEVDVPSQKPGAYAFIDAFQNRATTPTVNGGYSDGNDAHASNFTDKISVNGGRLVVGYAFDASLPDWAGKNFRIEASYEDGSGSGSATGTVTLPSGGWNRINGNLGSGAGPFAFDHYTHVDIERDAFQVGVAADYALGQKLTLSPSLAYIDGNRAMQTHVRNYLVALDDLITEDVNVSSKERGLKLGAIATFHATPLVDVYVGASIAGVRRKVSMSGTDCGDGAAPGSLFGTCSGVSWRTSATDRASATSTLTSFLIGATYRVADSWFVNASIAAQRDGRAATYRMPTPSSPAAASIRFESTKGYEANLRLGIYF
jgi:hypothetical protein